MIGSSLGPYRILDSLGAGGMGEVYLGEDTRLGRKVAIKVLPAEFASDPERLARFEQEARAAAALNHPHIAVVHDIGFEAGAGLDEATTDPNMAAGGARAAGVHYMVQEYLEGEALRVPLERAALPLKKALDLAVEIAEGLTAAHGAGIVHRDLKPDNIFVTGAGHAKILDFGLAKLTEAAAATSDAQASRSPTMLGTVAGQVMGTAGYMAPEQVEATSEIDHRADLFAFGTVLYEMVTGRRAFSGSSVLDTLHAIAHADPPSIGGTDPSLPAELSRIVEKTLAKEPALRYQHADELVVDLRRLRDDVVAGDVTSIADRRGSTTAQGAGATRSTWLPVAAAGIFLSIGLAGGWWLHDASTTASRLDAYLTAAELRSSGVQSLAISPDGMTVAHITDGRLRYRRLDAAEWTDVAAADGVVVFSTSGNRLFYGRAGELWSVGLEGAPPQLVLDTEAVRIYFGWQEVPGELVISAFTTAPTPRTFLARVLVDRGELSELWNSGFVDDTALFPTGRIGPQRYTAMKLGQGGVFGAGVMSLESNEIGQWREGLGGLRVVRDGRILGVDNRGRLLSFALADNSESLIAEAEPVADGVRFVNGLAEYDVAMNGTVTMLAGAAMSVDGIFRLVWFDRTGRTEMATGQDRSFDVDTRLSPDGSLLAVEAPFDDEVVVWVHDLERDTATPLAVDFPGSFPVWSPASDEIVYHVRRAADGPPGMYRAPVDRSSPPVLLLPDPEGEFLLPMDWAPDGRTLLYARSPNSTRSGGTDLWTVPVDDGQPQVFIGTAANEIDGRFSADGRWIAYVSNHTGPREVYVRPAGGGGEIAISSAGGTHPEWHPSAPTLFFLSGDPAARPGRSVYSVDIVDGAASPVREVVAVPERASGLFIVSTDGERFMTAVGFADAPAAQMRVIVNPGG